MEFVKELLEEQKVLLKEELRFAEGLEYAETKQRLFEVNTALNKLFIRDVSHCGLSKQEVKERNHLIKLQKSRTRWFSEDEFNRLKELSRKASSNLRSAHCG